MEILRRPGRPLSHTTVYYSIIYYTIVYYGRVKPEERMLEENGASRLTKSWACTSNQQDMLSFLVAQWLMLKRPTL